MRLVLSTERPGDNVALSLVMTGAVAMIGGLAACTDQAVLAPVEHCEAQAGIEVCLERLLFAPGDPLPFTIANRTDRTVHVCPAEVVGRRGPEEEWDLSYGVVVAACEPPATEEGEEVAGTRSIPPGERIHDQLHVNGCAYEGEWKINVFLIDEGGDVVGEVSSPIFDVRGPTGIYCPG